MIILFYLFVKILNNTNTTHIIIIINKSNLIIILNQNKIKINPFIIIIIYVNPV